MNKEGTREARWGGPSTGAYMERRREVEWPLDRSRQRREG
jgi:hypothetical protein